MRPPLAAMFHPISPPQGPIITDGSSGVKGGVRVGELMANELKGNVVGTGFKCVLQSFRKSDVGEYGELLSGREYRLLPCNTGQAPTPCS